MILNVTMAVPSVISTLNVKTLTVHFCPWTANERILWIPEKVPNIKTKNKSNLANDDYSGFVENSNLIRFFPSVEERN